jgi:hypothetical protein
MQIESHTDDKSQTVKGERVQNYIAGSLSNDSGVELN